MDQVDAANIELEIFLKSAVYKATVEEINTSNPSKVCWFCEEPTDENRRWCSAQCCRDWEIERNN